MTLEGYIMRALAICQGYIPPRLSGTWATLEISFARFTRKRSPTDFLLGSKRAAPLIFIFNPSLRRSLFPETKTYAAVRFKLKEKNIIIRVTIAKPSSLIFRFRSIASLACSAWYENSIKVSIHSWLLFREARGCALSAASPDLTVLFTGAAIRETQN